MSASTTTDFTRCMAAVAIEILGEPNQALSRDRELRWGGRGSFCVDVDKGTWFDNEGGVGGGVLDLLKAKRGLKRADALGWLRERKYLSPGAPSKRRLIATYDYRDETGGLLFQVCRFDPKDFRQRRPDGSAGWIWKMAGVRLVLFRLPRVIEAVAAGRTICIVEGEKGVLALEGIGLVGTCSPGGAGKWRPEYGATALRDADVTILPDNDQPGRDHAAMVAQALRGVARRVRVLALPGLAEKADVADWIAAGGTAAGLEQLAAEADASPETVPPEPAAVADPDEGDAVAAVVRRFNDLYMIVNEGGSATIFQPGFDPVLRRRRLDRMTPRDLKLLYLPERIKVGVNKQGEPIMAQAADVWLRHRERREFIHGVVFDPTSTDTRPGVLNLWEGFAVTPARGNWSLLRDHIRDTICMGNRTQFDYLMGWLARMFQRPAEQGEVAVVMKGGEGTGKGTLARAVKHIIGHHALAISNAKHLVGNFNAHLRDCVLLFADEAFFAGDRAHVGVLKSLITEPSITIEAKYQNATEVPNYLHVMMASNEDWVVPASVDARRFLVLEVGNQHANDHAYFAAIWAQMEAGGYAAMLHDMLAMSISTFNVRAVPQTEGLQHQRKLSLATTEAWWLDCLERGYVFRSKLGLEAEFAAWQSKISTELLFASYTDFARARGERRPINREGLGRFFAELGAEQKRWRNGVVGEHTTDVTDMYGRVTRQSKTVKQDRCCGYHVGDLAAAQASFVKFTGLWVAWPGVGAKEEDPE